MSKKYSNNYTVSSKKTPAPQNNLQESEIIDDSREEYEDSRRIDFSIIDNQFIGAGFDSDTIGVYLRIVWRAANNSKGFFENRDRTSRALNISTRQLDYCRSLLQYCNIIKITKRYDPETKKQISSVITLIDKSLWKLDHEWRRAGDFGRRNSNKKKKDTLHPVQPPPASDAPTPLHPVQTEQDLKKNKITNEPDHLRSLSPLKPHNRIEKENCKSAGINLIKFIQANFSNQFIDYGEGEVIVENFLKECNIPLKLFSKEFMLFKLHLSKNSVLMNSIIDLEHFKTFFKIWLKEKYVII